MFLGEIIICKVGVTMQQEWVSGDRILCLQGPSPFAHACSKLILLEASEDVVNCFNIELYVL